MIVECSHCHEKYNIDEKKIPPAGVKVRCRKCSNIIYIKGSRSEQPTPVMAPKPEKQPISISTEISEVPKISPPVEEPERPEIKISEKPTPPPEERMSEEDKKWHERAKRLAKALASDLVLYNEEKVKQGLRDGTIAQLLGPEIRRSWEYYCQQIPKHVVDSTDYFREQLNSIVGKGQEIFK